MKGLGLLLALAGLLALLGTDGWAGCLAGWTSDGTIGITTLGRLVLFLRLLGGFALGLGLGLVLVGRPLVVVGRACWTSVVAEIKAWWMATRCVWNEMTLRERLALVFIVGVGALLRGLYLNLPIRLDEANSYITYISHPWLSVLGVVRYDPNNHPLYTCLAALSALLGGAREWVLRLPAFAAGVLLIPAVYLWGRQIAGSAAGLWGAALVAVCSPLVEYSVLARGYMLQTLLFLLMLIAAVRLTRHDCLGGWLLLVMLSGLGFFTMPSMLYGFGSVACWLFLTAMGEPVGPVRKRLILHLLLAAAVTGLLAILLYFPILVFSGPAAVLASKWTAPVPWYYFWTKWLDTLADIWRYLNRDLPGAVVVLLAVGFLYSQLRSGVLPKMRVPFSVAVLLGCAPLIFIQRVVPYTRVWLFLFQFLSPIF